ncbi:hypothetical protein [Pigmentiphaga litoralis]|uniref:3-isopropylmalate/(R)-2-methylmalate dehydratase small subunit n=1 Tax=Pigmentiphaga litoralis TaxID=516702 RepID=A0A7Y9IW82_9BURK|nr:hypothetical protein [Pigmentiphaga litoralis]NYE22184.1 3-isopropylmalate/(R)-2-methylmalate dehydratase small subunit [Pigmentiphaga litoralis]NYE84201.1 3-isopropylmalate/(R)-2-methylmalate dehydratase small subunit [Pigmentiphaga litoralis]
MTARLLRRGRCHVFGDDIPLDEGLIPFDMAIRRIDDPSILVPELFRQIDPAFHDRVRPGDIIVAGRNFCCGKPHLQGFIAMASLGLSVICTSMPYKAMRGAVAKGVAVMTGVDIQAFPFKTGDDVEVDYTDGTVRNVSQTVTLTGEALSATLTDIVAEGGTRGQLRTWLRDHPIMSTELPRPD